MRQKQKKKNERYYLNLVLSADEFDTPGCIVEGEEPDFLLEWDSTVIGVEITELVREQPTPGSKTWEGACKAVLESARRVWESHSLQPVNVSVTFNKATDFPKSSRGHWGGVLVQIVQQVLSKSPEPQAVAGRGPRHLVVPVTVPPELVQIIVDRKAEAGSWWTMSTGGSLPSLTVETLQRLISKKNQLVKNYRRRAPIHWLIVAMSTSYSSAFSLHDCGALDAEYESLFERVFVVPLGHKEFYELNCNQPEGDGGRRYSDNC